MRNIALLHAAIAAVCPIDGVSIGDPAALTTWRIDYRDEATPEQRAAAQAVLESIDPTAPSEADYGFAVQTHIEATARSHSYNDAATCASYVGSTVAAWQADAETFVGWRDAVWLYVYAQLAAVQGGQREQPSIEALIAELPAIAWPAQG